MKNIFHVGPLSLRRDLKDALAYYPDNYDRAGFTHCSYLHQLDRVLSRHFKHPSRLLVLEINRNKIISKIIDEKPIGAEEFFPHIYGPIEISAICNMHDVIRGDDGNFDLKSLI